MSEVRWFAKTFGGEAAIVNLPRGDAWWSTPAGLLIQVAGGLLLDDGERIAWIPGAEPHVEVTSALVDIASDRGCYRLSRGPGGVTIDAVSPSAADRSAFGIEGLQAAQQVAFDGARVTWVANGFAYTARSAGEPASCIARGVADLQRVAPGLVLLGDDERWTHQSRNGRAAAPLGTPLLRRPWGVRVSPDGRALAGLNDELEPVLVVEEQVTPLAGWPLDTTGVVLTAAGSLLGADGHALREGLREASWALRDGCLAGPGGLIWSLGNGAPLSGQRVVRYGVTVASTDERWLSLDWESGEGAWLDLASGTITATRVPLDELDIIEGAAALPDGAVIVQTSLGQRFSLTADGLVAVTSEPLPEQDDPAVVDEATIDEATIGGGPRAHIPDGLPWDAATERDGRWWFWSSDGLLLAGPAPADHG